MGVPEPFLPQTPGRRMKIAYVVDIFDDNSVGGVQSSRRFVEALKRHHDVTVISTGEPASGKVCVPVQSIPGFNWIIEKNGFAIASPARDILRQALPGHDVVYIHYTLLLGYSALREAKRLGIPVVFGYHFQPQNIFYNLRMNLGWLNRALARLFVRHFYNKADHVVCPSRLARNELDAFGFTGVASIISNGLPERFRPGNFQRPPRFEGQFVILMVSRLSREKRHDLVLRAIARSRNAGRIRLVATGKGPVQKQIEQSAVKLSIEAEVGYVADAQLIELYNCADLLIHASEAELEGMAVLEAIGCGLPALIAKADSSASSQFALDERFLFQANAVDELAARIDYWIEHPGELARSRALYLQKSRQYGFDRARQQLELLLLRVAGMEPVAGDIMAPAVMEVETTD